MEEIVSVWNFCMVERIVIFVIVCLLGALGGRLSMRL
jgi:hypothetical protein